MNSGNTASFSGMAYNLFFVTLGNMVGGILFLGIGTYFLSTGDKKAEKVDRAA